MTEDIYSIYGTIGLARFFPTKHNLQKEKRKEILFGDIWQLSWKDPRTKFPTSLLVNLAVFIIRHQGNLLFKTDIEREQRVRCFVN